MNIIRWSSFILIPLALSACDFSCSKKDDADFLDEGEPKVDSIRPKVGPNFDENYAYSLILDYEKFGPKVPGTPAHQKAGDWIVKTMKELGATVHEQKGSGKTFDGKTIPIRNIIAQLNPNAKTRYLLSAHWDNRPFADNDSGANRKKAVPGVNDGGSGVVVLMAIAKAIQGQPPSFGIDFAFWDAEDWGSPSRPESYCLGSQLWAKNPIPSGYSAKFGVNFDMVGRLGSQFPIERYSIRRAPAVMKDLLQSARDLGYQDLFPSYEIGPIVDDHYFASELTGIPYIDLIYMTEDGRFAPEWHTIDDTSKFISREVLKAVGQTTIQLIWSQK